MYLDKCKGYIFMREIKNRAADLVQISQTNLNGNFYELNEIFKSSNFWIYSSLSLILPALNIGFISEDDLYYDKIEMASKEREREQKLQYTRQRISVIVSFNDQANTTRFYCKY